MHSWHVTPEYINDNWTEEQFLLLFRMRNRRMLHESGKTPKKKLKPMDAASFMQMFGADITVVTEEEGDECQTAPVPVVESA
jgi:hypothetical protein